MSQNQGNQQPTQATNTQQKPMALTIQALNNSPTVTGILEMEQVKNNWVSSYKKVTGKDDGETKFEAERILFLQATAAKNFKDCDKFSLYSAFIELAISGLTLRDGISYLVPYGKKVQFMPGWKGRLEQIMEMPDVVYAHEPQIVREGDVFEYELGMSPRVTKHVPVGTGPITHVYFVIDFTHGSRVYFMKASEVENIRDRRSSSYKYYMADCQRFNKTPGETFQKNVGTYDITVEPPMWITDEAQAFKKTIVKRVYNTLPKLAKHKYIDDNIEAAKLRGLSDVDADLTDSEDFDKLKGIVDSGEEYQQGEVISSTTGTGGPTGNIQTQEGKDTF